MARLIEVLAVLFATLFSYYFYTIHLAVLPLLSLLSLGWLILSQQSTPPRKITVLFAVSVSFLLLSNIVLAMARLGSTQFYLNSVFAVITGPSYYLLLYWYFNDKPGRLLTCLNWALMFHVGALCLQLITFYTLGFYLDLLEPITGEQQRVAGTGLIANMIRPSGFFNEPATYSLTIVMLLFIRNRFRAPLNRLDYIALVSVLVTLSLSGTFFVVLFLLFHIFVYQKDILKKLIYGGLCATGVATTIGPLLFSYVNKRLSGIQTDGSYISRFQGGLDHFRSRPYADQLFGTGIGNRDTWEQDSYGSTYSFLSNHLGFIFSALVLLILFWHLKRTVNVRTGSLVFLSISFLGTFQITYILFWFMLSTLAILENSAGWLPVWSRLNVTFEPSVRRPRIRATSRNIHPDHHLTP